MNWEAISAIGEITGAVAVLISLIYLALQIRQNTKMMRSTAKQQLAEASQNVIYITMENPEEWIKLQTGETASSPDQDAKMSLLVRAIMRGFESQCYHYESGLLEDDEWQALKNTIIDITSRPGVNKYWQEMKSHMSERLRIVVEGKVTS